MKNMAIAAAFIVVCTVGGIVVAQDKPVSNAVPAPKVEVISDTPAVAEPTEPVEVLTPEPLDTPSIPEETSPPEPQQTKVGAEKYIEQVQQNAPNAIVCPYDKYRLCTSSN